METSAKGNDGNHIVGESPHSLGTLIEWKLVGRDTMNGESVYYVPTRWGH